jgi:hypothetical protein
LLEAVSEEADLATRERYLSAGVGPELFAELASRGGEAAGGAELALFRELLGVRVALGRPGGVLRALEGASGWLLELEDVASARVEALVAVNRLDEAADADDALGEGAVEAWLAGLRAAASQPHAGVVVDRMRLEFDGSMTADEAAALAEIESSLEPASGEEGAGGSEGGDGGGGGVGG